MVVILVIASADASGSKLSYFSSIAIVLIFVLIPLAFFIRRKVKRREWENIDASNQEERPAFYLVAISLLILLNTIFYFLPGYKDMTKGGLGVLMLLIIHALLNKKIKASLHTAFAIFTTVFLLSINFYAGLIILIAVIPLLVWSRLLLKRHSIREIITGIITGSISGLTAIYFF
jgi:membrane-associated phospholipid phosphatase